MNCRYDGSSKFPRNRRFAIFPSVSAGWLDKYYLEQVPLDQIKLNPQLEQNPGY